MTNLDKELINYLPSNSPTMQYMLDEIKRQDENIELMNMFLLNETDAKVMLVKTDDGIIPYTA